MSWPNLVKKQIRRQLIWNIRPTSLIGTSFLRRRIIFVSILVAFSATTSATLETNDLQDVKFVGEHELNLQNLLRTKYQDSEMFAALGQERRWAVDTIRVLADKLTLLEGQKQTRQKPAPVPVISETEYNGQRLAIDNKIREGEKNQNSPDLDERKKIEAQLELVDLTRQKARLDLRLEESREYDQQLSEYRNLEQQVSDARKLYGAVQHYLSVIDDEISKTLLKRQADNRFRMLMGGAFVLLVAVLIIGFFLIARTEPDLRRGFLADDRGLQFIALFSLIIAITLFGLMNVLEGRELSALLGGLAGYILGRSNLGQAGRRESNDGGGRNHLAQPIQTNERNP
jgi:hypothetical protein